jgi:hypothetical protein
MKFYDKNQFSIITILSSINNILRVSVIKINSLYYSFFQNLTIKYIY